MTVKIEKVTFTITNLDEENAGVHVVTDPPLPDDMEDLEDSPAYDLGAALWEHIQSLYDGEVGQLQ
jgi:hypothetical protein